MLSRLARNAPKVWRSCALQSPKRRYSRTGKNSRPNPRIQADCILFASGKSTEGNVTYHIQSESSKSDSPARRLDDVVDQMDYLPLSSCKIGKFLVRHFGFTVAAKPQFNLKLRLTADSSGNLNKMLYYLRACPWPVGTPWLQRSPGGTLTGKF